MGKKNTSTIARATRQLPISYMGFLGFVLPQPSLSLPYSSLGQGVPGLVPEELVQERVEAADCVKLRLVAVRWQDQTQRRSGRRMGTQLCPLTTSSRNTCHIEKWQWGRKMGIKSCLSSNNTVLQWVCSVCWTYLVTTTCCSKLVLLQRIQSTTPCAQPREAHKNSSSGLHAMPASLPLFFPIQLSSLFLSISLPLHPTANSVSPPRKGASPDSSACWLYFSSSTCFYLLLYTRASLVTALMQSFTSRPMSEKNTTNKKITPLLWVGWDFDKNSVQHPRP